VNEVLFGRRAGFRNGQRRLSRRAAYARTTPVERVVPGDPEQPRAEAARLELRSLRLQRPEERVVERVLRLGAVPERGDEKPEEPVLVAGIERVERGDVSRAHLRE